MCVLVSVQVCVHVCVRAHTPVYAHRKVGSEMETRPPQVSFSGCCLPCVLRRNLSLVGTHQLGQNIWFVSAMGSQAISSHTWIVFLLLLLILTQVLGIKL